MLHMLSKKKVLYSSLTLMVTMFIVVMFYVNPSIDGGNGSSVIELQLSFSKENGSKILAQWGSLGIESFKSLIVADYIYALSYSLFFASLLSFLILKKGKGLLFRYTIVVPISFMAGTLDWIENTIELFFISNQAQLPEAVFFTHSIIATLKWATIPVAVIYIIVLLSNKSEVAQMK